MTTEELNAALEAVEQIVGDFLLANGGMQNGYETGVDGTISKDGSHLEFVLSYEQRKKLTFADAKELSNELGCLVQEAMDADFWAVFKTIKLDSKHIESGCFETLVTAVTTPTRVDLYKARDRAPEPEEHDDDGSNGFEPAEVEAAAGG